MLSCISHKNCLLCSFDDLFLDGVVGLWGTFLGSMYILPLYSSVVRYITSSDCPDSVSLSAASVSVKQLANFMQSYLSVLEVMY